MSSTAVKSNARDGYELALALASAALFVAAAIAVAKGHEDWNRIPAVIWWHLGTIGLALALTPVLLLRRRGDDLHRVLGWVWAIAMFSTAVITLFVRVINPGKLSLIHILSVVTIVAVPRLVLKARRHQIMQHRRDVRTVIAFAMLAAGVLTFPFGRMLGAWLMR
ncbi:MAG: hypothetical protein RL299_40 [Pseudomonadota bacterium]